MICQDKARLGSFNIQLPAPVHRIQLVHPLEPDPDYQERTFQTKSLECCLSDYTITREGRLVLREVEWEATPEEEMPYYGTPEWEQGGIVRFFGCMREKSSRDVVLDDFHGDIVFYKTVNAPDDAVFAINFREGTTSVFETDGTTTPIQPVTVYYKARVSDGWLQWVRRITEAESYREFAGGGW